MRSSRAKIDGFVEELVRTRQREIRSGIQETVDSVLASTSERGLSDPRWQYRTTKESVAYYVDSTILLPGRSRYCSIGKAPASAEDIVSLFLATDTAVLERLARVLSINVHEIRVLSMLDPPTEDSPFKSSYVSYVALDSPMPLNDRDLCLIVATDVVPHTDGSKIGYCLWDSIEVPEHSHFVRSKMFRSGYVCWTPPYAKHSEIIFLVELAIGGSQPRLTTWLVMERIGSQLARLCDHFRRKRLDPATFRPREQWPSKWRARYCRGCVKRFTRLFSKRSHCVACGMVFCSACCEKERVDLGGFTSLRICRSCLRSRGLVCGKPLHQFHSEVGLQKILDETYLRLQLHSSERSSCWAPITAKIVGVEW